MCVWLWFEEAIEHNNRIELYSCWIQREKVEDPIIIICISFRVQIKKNIKILMSGSFMVEVDRPITTIRNDAL